METQEKKLLHRISSICHQIARGNYASLEILEEMTIKARYPKVVANLAESFSLMILKLEGREHELREALERLKEKNASLENTIDTLKIDIDVLKKKKTVSRIAESEFFKTIKKKAKKHRRSK